LRERANVVTAFYYILSRRDRILEIEKSSIAVGYMKWGKGRFASVRVSELDGKTRAVMREDLYGLANRLFGAAICGEILPLVATALALRNYLGGVICLAVVVGSAILVYGIASIARSNRLKKAGHTHR
jgi:hypothetical protein